jgi:hypothetical protein
MAVLIIVFAWLPYSWNKIVITILGILLAAMALIGTCCCAEMAKAREAGTAEAKETEQAEAKE